MKETAVNSGWLEKRFSAKDTYIVLLNPGSECSLRIRGLENIGFPRTTYNIVMHDTILPVASHAEGILFNVTVDEAPAEVFLELTPIFSFKNPENIWVGADLVNSSGYVVSATPLKHVSLYSNEALIKFIAPVREKCIVALNYVTGEPCGVGFHVEF